MLDDLLGGLLGALLGEQLVDRRSKKLMRSGMIDCGVRVLSGQHHGLTEKWRHGRARLGPGTIRLEGLTALTVQVRRIDRSMTRRPVGRETWTVSPRTEVMLVHTDGAVLEWAVLRDRRAWAVQQVQPPSS